MDQQHKDPANPVEGIAAEEARSGSPVLTHRRVGISGSGVTDGDAKTAGKAWADSSTSDVSVSGASAPSEEFTWEAKRRDCWQERGFYSIIILVALVQVSPPLLYAV